MTHAVDFVVLLKKGTSFPLLVDAEEGCRLYLKRGITHNPASGTPKYREREIAMLSRAHLP